MLRANEAMSAQSPVRRKGSDILPAPREDLA